MITAALRDLADRVRKILVQMLPRRGAEWLWCWSEDSGHGLGAWAPHIFGRMLGGKATWKRIDR